MSGEMSLTPFQQRVANVRKLFLQIQPEIARAVPAHLKPERLLRVALTSIQRTPKLLDCTPVSLMGALFECGQLGLVPDGVLGEAYLIPFKDKCQLLIGYKGLLTLAERTGKVKSIVARVVRKKDKFDFEYGLNERLVHKPLFTEDMGNDKKNPLVGVYAVARLNNGAAVFDVMSRAEVNAVRDRSRAADEGPWVTDYDAMSLKSVLRRLCNRSLPRSVELSTAVANDELKELGIAPEPEAPEEALEAAAKLLGSAPEDTAETHEASEGAEAPAEGEGAEADDRVDSFLKAEEQEHKGRKARAK